MHVVLAAETYATTPRRETTSIYVLKILSRHKEQPAVADRILNLWPQSEAIALDLPLII